MMDYKECIPWVSCQSVSWHTLPVDTIIWWVLIRFQFSIPTSKAVDLLTRFFQTLLIEFPATTFRTMLAVVMKVYINELKIRHRRLAGLARCRRLNLRQDLSPKVQDLFSSWRKWRRGWATLLRTLERTRNWAIAVFWHTVGYSN